MKCGIATDQVTTQQILAVPVLPGQRVGDRQRDDVQAVLGLGFALGYLDVEELDDRTGQALTATTGADLARLTADLPVAELRDRDPARRATLARAARLGVRIHLGAYVVVTLLLLGVWLLVGLTGGGWFPWPVWPILGWGIGVASHAVPVHRTLQRPDWGTGSRLASAATPYGK